MDGGAGGEVGVQELPGRIAADEGGAEGLRGLAQEDGPSRYLGIGVRGRDGHGFLLWLQYVDIPLDCHE